MADKRTAEMNPEHKKQRKRCDKFWSEIILLRAGYRSEIWPFRLGKQIDPENGSVLVAHHILKKPNLRLRYELNNGICLTAGEHHYGVHGSGEERYRKLIMQARGEDIYERLYPLRNETIKDLTLVEIFLRDELQKLKKQYGSS